MVDLFDRFLEEQRQKTDLMYQSMFSAAAGPGNSNAGNPGKAPPSLEDQLKSISPSPSPSRGPGIGNTPSPAPAPKPKAPAPSNQGSGPSNTPTANKPRPILAPVRSVITPPAVIPRPTVAAPFTPVASLGRSVIQNMTAPVVPMPTVLSRPAPVAMTQSGYDTGGATGGTTEEGDGTYSIYFDNENGSEILVEDGTAESGEYTDNDRYSVGREGMTEDEVIEYGGFSDDPAFGTDAPKTPLMPRGVGQVSQADMNRAIARGNTAKRRDGPIAEPKDIPGYNTLAPSEPKPADGGGLWSDIGNTVSGVWGSVEGGVSDAAGKVKDTVSDIYSGVRTVVENPDVVVNNAIGPIVETVDAGTGAVEDVVELAPAIVDQAVDAILDSPVGEFSREAAISLSFLWEDLKDEAQAINQFAPLWIDMTKRGISESGLPGVLDNAVDLLPAPIRGPLREVVPRIIEWSGWAQNEVAEFIFDNYADIVETGGLRLGPINIDLPDAFTFPIQVIDDASRLADPDGMSLSEAIRAGRQGGALDWINRTAFDNTLIGYMWVLGFQVITDPLTWVPFAGAAFKGIKGAGLLRSGARGFGRALDVAEGVSDLGLGYAAQGLFRGIPRLPIIRGAFAPTDESARGITGNAGREAFGELEGAPISKVPTRPVPVDISVDPPQVDPVPGPTSSENLLLIREALLEERASVRESMDQLQKEFLLTENPTQEMRDAFYIELQRHSDYLKKVDEAVLQTPIPSEPGSTVNAAAGTPTPMPPRRPVEGIDGTGPQITNRRGRQIEPNETGIDGGPAAIKTATGPLDVSEVPRRFHPYLRNLANVNDAQSVRLLIDDTVAGRGFTNQVNTTSGPKGNATPTNALDTSAFTADLYDSYRAINPNAVLPAFTPSTAASLGAPYRNMEAAIHQPWETTTASRQALSDGGYILDTIPSGALTDAQQAALAAYVRLIDQYKYWHPTSLSDVNFAAASRRADRIDKYFTDRGMARPSRPKRGAGGGQGAPSPGDTPRTAANGTFTPGSTTTAQTGRPSTTAAAAPPTVHQYGDVAGYPIIPGTATGPNAATIVRIDADTNVALTPVAIADVPTPARERFPDDATESWTEAVVQDAKLKNPTPHYAPTREQALDLAIEDAKSQGLVGEFFDRPANRQTSESLDIESEAKVRSTKVSNMPGKGQTRSNIEGMKIAHSGTIDLGGKNAPVWKVTTPDGTATIVREGRTYRVAPDAVVNDTILADMDRVPSFDTHGDALVEAQMQARFGVAFEPTGSTLAAASPITPETKRAFAVRNGIMNTQTADALDTYARTRSWTETRSNNVFDLMNRVNRKQGQPVVTTGDLSTASGRRQFGKIEEHARLQEANVGLARGLEGKTGKKRQQLQARIDKNRVKIRQLETDLRMNNRTAVTSPGQWEVSSLAESSRMPVRQRALSKAVNSLKTLVVQDVPVASMPMPSGIQQFDGMTYIEGVPISEKSLVELTRYSFDNGETVIDRISRKVTSFRGNPTMWDGTNPGDILDRAFAETRTEYEALLDQLFPIKAKRTGPLRSFGIFTGLSRDAILANALTGWTRYLFTQYLGNMHLSFLASPDLGLDLAKRTITQQKKIRGAIAEMYDVTGSNPIRVAEDMTDTERFDMAAGLPPSGAVFDIQTGEFGQRRTEIGNWWEDHFQKKPPAPVRAALGDDRIYREGLIADTLNRDNAYQKTTGIQLAVDQRAFDAQARTRLTDAGLDDVAVQAAMDDFYGTVDMPWGWKATQVRAEFSKHLDEAISDRLARDWQNAINTRRKLANDEVKRITFGGSGRTKLDDFLSNFIMFHYFQSRQLKFLTTQALKHPALLNFYVNSQEALNDYADDHLDMPSWLRGSIRAGKYFGVAVYLDPFALLQVGSIYGNVTDTLFEDKDKTWLTEKLGTDIPFVGGTIEDWFFINPVISQSLNLFGFLGDDRNVDIFNTNQWGRVAALITNVGANKGWWGEPGDITGNLVTNFWNKGRDWASGIGLPGSAEVAFVDQVNQEERKLNGLIEDIATEKGLNPDNPEDAALIEAAKNDPNHPWYKAAWHQYVIGEVVGIGVRSMPILASLRPQTRLLNQNNKDLINNQTGRSEVQLRNITDPVAGAIYVGNKGYYALGDPFDPLIDDLRNDIVYGNITESVTLGGVTYTPEQINGWDEETRKDFASAFLVDNGFYEKWQGYKEEQAEYLADPANAEFAQYKSWSGDLRQYPGGIEQYWQDVADGNPNAKRWYENIDPDLTPEEREQVLTSQRGFMAVKGVQPDYNDPTPIDTNSFDPLNIANGPAKPIENEPYVSEYDQSFMDDYDAFVSYAVEAEPVMQGILTEYGYDPNTPLNAIPYRTRADIQDAYYDRTGYPYPEPKGAVLDYFQWSAQQPTGTDTSPEAYLIWSNDQYVAKMPTSFNEDIETKDTIDSGTFDPREFVEDSRTKDEGYSWESQDWWPQPVQP